MRAGAARREAKLCSTLSVVTTWVVPRLARLHTLDRSLDVQVTTSHMPADFDREDIDVAIHSGAAPERGICTRLFGEMLLPACVQPRLPGRAAPVAYAVRYRGPSAAVLAAPSG
jgi:DNA-binding transcriptional LysR family regulator